MEKRGVLEIVKYIGDIYGFAFVNTQGHFAEYPKDLIRQIIENGGNVAILTDFDCAGTHIAEKVISDRYSIFIGCINGTVYMMSIWERHLAGSSIHAHQ